MEISAANRRPRAGFLAAGVVLGAILGLAACGTGGEDRPPRASSAPSVDRPSLAPSVGRTTGGRPESSEGPESPPAVATPTARTRTPDATEAPTPTRAATTAAAPESAAPTPERTTAAAKTPTQAAGATTAASSLPATAASDTAGGLGALGWFLLIVLVAAFVAGALIWRSRRKADWATGADALAADTRVVVDTRLPAVLATVNAAQRALSWPPVRADLVNLAGQWALLPGSAPGDEQADWSRQVWNLLQGMIAAVDAENEALATGREWRLLRPRVEETGRALDAMLAVPQGVGPDAPVT